MQLQGWLTIGIAALSLVVSALTLFLHFRQKKEQIRVTASLGFQVSPMSVSETQFHLAAANVGERNVTLSSFGFRMPNKQVMILPFGEQHVRLPHELQPGKSCTMYMPVASAVEALVGQGYKSKVKLVPQFAAQSGVTFRGKALRFNVAAWPQT